MVFRLIADSPHGPTRTKHSAEQGPTYVSSSKVKTLPSVGLPVHFAIRASDARLFSDRLHRVAFVGISGVSRVPQSFGWWADQNEYIQDCSFDWAS